MTRHPCKVGNSGFEFSNMSSTRLCSAAHDLSFCRFSVRSRRESAAGLRISSSIIRSRNW